MKTLEISNDEIETLKIALSKSVDNHIEYANDNGIEDVGVGFLEHLVSIFQLYRKVEIKAEEKQV